MCSMYAEAWLGCLLTLKTPPFLPCRCLQRRACAAGDQVGAQPAQLGVQGECAIAAAAAGPLRLPACMPACPTH